MLRSLVGSEMCIRDSCMTLQLIVDGAQNIRKSRRAQIDYGRTQGGVVRYARQGPFITTFEITPGYPTHAVTDSFVGQYNTFLLGPYNISFKSETVRTLGDIAGSSPQVAGVGQTGTTLNIDGLNPSTVNVLRQGDVIRITGVEFTYVVTNNVSSSGTGTTTLTLDMPLQSSPGDNAAITVGSDIVWPLYLEQVPDDTGLGRIPGFSTYGGTFVLREGQ